MTPKARRRRVYARPTDRQREISYLVTQRSLSRRWGSLLRELGLLFLGFMTLVSIWLFYLTAHNALGDFWDAVFRYNTGYVTLTTRAGLRTIAEGLRALSPSGTSIIALASWAMGVFYLVLAKHEASEKKALLSVALIALPLELVSAGVVGRPVGHYFIAWTPLFALLAGFFAYLLQFQSAAKVRTEFPSSFVSLALLLAMTVQPAWALVFRATSVEGGYAVTAQVSQVVRYVQEQTSGEEHVLVWGGEPLVNFLARRRSPSRFVYQHPLYDSTYQNRQMIEEFIGEFISNKPALIIDISPSDSFIPPVDPASRLKWKLGGGSSKILPEMDKLFTYISSNYEFATAVGPWQWPVYRYVGIDPKLPLPSAATSP